jgi:glutathione S-transferase
MEGPMAELELFQFARSHYNEKARWALDFKGLPHVRHSLIPGPHMFTTRRLSGQQQVPVLRRGDEVVAGSAQIIARLEELQPEPNLYPMDPGQLEGALAIQARFDEEVGPAVRLAMFAELQADPGYFASLFTDDRSLPVRAAYRCALPVLQMIMNRDLGLTPEAIPPALAVTREALDFVAENAGPSGHLVGDDFSVADLTAACLLMPAVLPEGGVRYPEPLPDVVRSWVARFSEHPGAAWVREIYARHRGSSAATHR